MALGDTLAVMAASYPRQEFPSVTVQAYMAGLRDLDERQVARAVERLIKRSEWLPSIAEIRREYAEALCGLPSVSEAWEAVQTMEGRQRASLTVRRALEAIGGSYALRMTDRPGQLQHQFGKVYSELREHEVRQVSEGGRPQLPPAERRPG